MTNLNGRSIIITGASSGIGAATARELANAGMKIMLAARREDRLQKLQSELEKNNTTAQYRVTDVTNRAAMQDLARQTNDAFGTVDAIFNNAGLMPLSMFDKLHVDEWDQMVDVNIKGVLYGIAAVLPIMRKQGHGHIINNASIAGHKIFPAASVYCGTKWAVRAISEGLRMEAGENLRCTIISPGAIDTELPDHITDTDAAKGVSGAYRIAVGPDAIARAVRFALEQPENVDVNEIIVRPTAQQL